jgi:hypothetical protein
MVQIVWELIDNKEARRKLGINSLGNFVLLLEAAACLEANDFCKKEEVGQPTAGVSHT